MTAAYSKGALPKDPSFNSDDEYVTSLLKFITSCELFQRLCGGVHILDFLTKEPDLYSTILPQDWRDWFQLHDVYNILDLLMREDDSILEDMRSARRREPGCKAQWRDGPAPPGSLVDYVLTVRRHSLDRHFVPNSCGKGVKVVSLQRSVAVGMKPKKIHEVQNFAKYIDDLSTHVTSFSPHKISHIIDFGSGQNYLGRALASPPYKKRVIALESKPLNIDGARSMDIHAKLAEKEKTMRNKKQYRSEVNGSVPLHAHAVTAVPAKIIFSGSDLSHPLPADQPVIVKQRDEKITYLQTLIRDGDLSQVIKCIKANSSPSPSSDPQLMVISLHSCGNLLHHGVRSLILNPAVKAIAMVGCCYNLVTERLGPPTFKLPSLRSSNLRLDMTSSARDPHGFPMSQKLASYQHQYGEGIRLNITARMMAVQAPQNWTAEESESFFTRHYYRALLQRIFLDRGLVSRPVEVDDRTEGASPRGWTGTGPPITIGSLRKACYASFRAYVQGALKKLSENSDFAESVEKHMQNLTDDEVGEYENRYHDKKKALSIVWSLMAFSASVVESVIVVDRWLYLKEHGAVKECWVEAVFEYGQSPRNLAVVAIKK